MPIPRVMLPAVLLLAAVSMPHVATAQVDCAAMDDPIHHRVNPTSEMNLLTTSLQEAEGAEVNYGFTDDRGAPAVGSRTPASGLVAVHRLYKPGDFVWITNQAEIASAVANYGYTDQGVNFYAASAAAGCTEPVHRYRKGGKHRHAFSETERTALVAAGWLPEGVSFHARPSDPPAVDTVFSFAVIPDTQNEVFPGRAAQHVGRTQWLADNRDLLDLRFVMHSGDITNWGEREEPQYQVAASALVPLEQAGIPFGFTPGNHDTRAVCAGGSACPGESATTNVRLLPLFSQYFNGRFSVNGRYEAGKLDNYYTLFEAGGADWLVLSLELWPRTAVVNWARGVVAEHASHNVIVVTHSYLNADGTISTSNGGYGANSPKYLFDNLVSQYANVRFVFSGHVGQGASRTDTGVNGNKVASFLQGFHSTTNPVRIVEIDTAADEASTWIYAPHTQTEYPQYDVVVTGLDFIE